MDSVPDPALIERFGDDLAALGFVSGKLGLAVSGGPDSLAMLLLAHAALPGRVEAATVDHGLRAESADEAAMVARVCADLGVPHRTLRVAVEPGNLHDRAREARYHALGVWLAERRLQAIATAHHADDQAETLLMRLNRGSGLAGLAGVRPVGVYWFNDPVAVEFSIYRPLLGWRCAELDSVVAAAGLEPVRDPSNDDERFERARVRAFLAGQDWIDPVAVAESARHLAEAEEAVADAANKVYTDCVTSDGDALVFGWGHARLVEIKVVVAILRELGAGNVRTSAIAQAVDRLRRGENASLGGVLARRVMHRVDAHRQNDSWRFEPEPPRRSR